MKAERIKTGPGVAHKTDRNADTCGPSLRAGGTITMVVGKV
jgi:hypothetical protein